MRGIEPLFRQCHCRVLPLDDIPIQALSRMSYKPVLGSKAGEEGVEPSRDSFRDCCPAIRLLPKRNEPEKVGKDRIELSASRLSGERSNR